jgi:hypothetical protein
MEELLQHVTNFENASTASEQDDFEDFDMCNFCAFHDFRARFADALEQIVAHFLELRAGDGCSEIHALQQGINFDYSFGVSR